MFFQRSFKQTTPAAGTHTKCRLLLIVCQVSPRGMRAHNRRCEPAFILNLGRGAQGNLFAGFSSKRFPVWF